MSFRVILAAALALLALGRSADVHAANDAETLLLRQPSISKDHLAFVYGGDIWVSDRDGQRPLRLTSAPGAGICAAFFARRQVDRVLGDLRQ